jgi:tRNA dimethylallyltransferase
MVYLMKSKKSIIIISGPTATGKTGLSIELSKENDIEIINFDSLSFYQELDIGVARPSNEQQQQVPHHLVGFQSIKKPLNAADFVPLANERVMDITDRGKTPVLVGGSGFYLQAFLKGMFPGSTVPASIIKKSDILFQQEGIKPFLEILEQKDPPNFTRLHPNDHYRIRRAVEYFWHSGKPFSQAKQEFEQNDQSQFVDQFNIMHCYVDCSVEEHLPIINMRTLSMIDQGFINEVENLLKRFSGQEKPMLSVGYKEVQAYLRKEIPTQSELVQLINQSTRQLAKAQRTWFKKVEKKQYHCQNDKDKLIRDISLTLEQHE